jgi:hypothetical protein
MDLGRSAISSKDTLWLRLLRLHHRLKECRTLIKTASFCNLRWIHVGFIANAEKDYLYRPQDPGLN